MATMIFYEDTFEAAHQLPNIPSDHPCSGMHGHRYEVQLVVQGALDDRGFVIDYDEVAAAWKPVREQLDHKVLNTVRGLENPTAEILAGWIADRVYEGVKRPNARLTKVIVRETSTCGVILDLTEVQTVMAQHVSTQRINESIDALTRELTAMRNSFGRRLAELRLEKEHVLHKRGAAAWYARQVGWKLRPEQWGMITEALGAEGAERWIALFDTADDAEVRQRWDGLTTRDRSVMHDVMDERQREAMVRLERIAWGVIDIEA